MRNIHRSPAFRALTAFAGACWLGASSCGGEPDSEEALTFEAPITGSPVGWASANGGTTGGGTAAVKVVTTLSAFTSAAAGTTKRVIQLGASMKGSVNIGSNVTIQGTSGVTFTGHLGISGSSNVILSNLRVVGFNCTDNSDCQSGADAVTIDKKAHNIWVDHCDISNGSDGNLDITHASDFVTISWTKFEYSGKRSGGHQFSNLIGHSDSNASEDTGHLRVTFHHDWWGANVGERMPRARFGQIHVFNNLFTSAGDNYCIRAGVSAKILTENNVFQGVQDPFDIAGGSLVSKGNLFTNVKGTTAGSGSAFTPPYSYSLASTSGLASAIMSGAGVH